MYSSLSSNLSKALQLKDGKYDKLSGLLRHGRVSAAQLFPQMAILAPMANRRKEEKELKRRYGKLAESMEAYYHHLDFRPLSDLDDSGFAYLMPRVKGADMLDLNETEIGNASIELISKLEYVKELRLKGCRNIDDDCIPFLNQVKGLELLHVKNTPITLRGLLQLRNQQGLKTLLFSGDSPEQQQAEIAQLK